VFRIVCDPSSGSTELYLTEIRIGSLMFVVCLIGVWQRHFWTSGVCVRYDGLTTSSVLVLRPSYRTYTHTHTHTHHWFKNYAAKHRSSKRQTSV